MRERDLAEEEAVRLRNVVRRQRKELRSRMAEVEREESAWIDDVILIEISRDRIIRSTCESLARHTIERIQSTFPAYDGIGMNSSIQVDATKFLDILEGDVPKDVQRLNKLCLEWKEVEDSLRKKWKKIEEFDSHR
ncbi:hypothetical protein HPP92_006257 [Vanilla planifolia]|uniref:Uncharacterized protein n=1 Tax=Vanilla planifolia TaxID=51239 RepID=A0A835VFH5_VANPL|nr:hypothetical protein HPP92_006257 [Vanilla planifolia]